MDNRNLTAEQLAKLDGAISVIDRALELIDKGDMQPAVILLHDARSAVNAVTTGKRLDLGPQV